MGARQRVELGRLVTGLLRTVPCDGGSSAVSEQSRRFTVAGQDIEGRPRTLIGWREVDLINGAVQRRVVLTLDATMKTAVVLTPAQAIQLAELLLEAAR